MVMRGKKTVKGCIHMGIVGIEIVYAARTMVLLTAVIVTILTT